MTTEAMEEARAPPGQPPKYEEDARPTSRKELAGWYSYGWAAEVFAVCAMGEKGPPSNELV